MAPRCLNVLRGKTYDVSLPLEAVGVLKEEHLCSTAMNYLLRAREKPSHAPFPNA